MSELTPEQLAERLDTLGCMADALEILSRAESEDAEKRERAIGALASEIAISLDTLYGDVQAAMEDGFLALGAVTATTGAPRRKR